MDTIKFEIPGKPDYLRMIRLAISSIASTAGFSVEDCEDIKTAVEEACKNVSCHGFEGFSDKFEVIVKVKEKYIEIAVKDACDDHSLAKIAKPCQNCPKEGDLGIFVIESLMNEVRFGKAEDGRKQIILVKSI